MSGRLLPSLNITDRRRIRVGSGSQAIIAGTALVMSGYPATGPRLRILTRSGFLIAGFTITTVGSWLRATGGKHKSQRERGVKSIASAAGPPGSRHSDSASGSQQAHCEAQSDNRQVGCKPESAPPIGYLISITSDAFAAAPSACSITFSAMAKNAAA